ncbi:hypothetical protein PATSB16_39510 [Pandoraea thiooxydans]|nr:hypothetical protein PATSB16_39510 [Pandoraea thiooxydans]
MSEQSSRFHDVISGERRRAGRRKGARRACGTAGWGAITARWAG